MKLKFDPSLEYQKSAIQAVVQALEGQPIAQTTFEISNTSDALGSYLTDLGIGNQISISEEKFFENIQKIQEMNSIEKNKFLDGRELSIEMETGTGKTYVYLRTIFELNKNYGLKKFVIVVPSIAIREGVLKSIELTKEHFYTLYNQTSFDSFVYDSSKLGKVRQFATSNQIQIMIINIQSFQKDVGEKDESEMTEEELKKLNIMNRENDRMSGRKPREFIQSTNPIVIIDEPQSVDNTPKAKKAIATLNPLLTLRYSATHKTPFNLVYRLDPIKAYDLRLVKRIEIDSVQTSDNFNDAYVKLLKTDNKNGIKAQIEFHKEMAGASKKIKSWVKQGDDLFTLSENHHQYQEGWIVQNIDCTPGSELIEFNQGRTLSLGQENGGFNEDIMKAQIEETVEQHFRKERAFKGKGIKVLSLFFIDKVSNYRIYNTDSSTSLGKIGLWLEEAFLKISKKPMYKDLVPYDVKEVHNGYFSQDRAGHYKDTTGKTKDDEDTYNLIMKDKERLLDPAVPLRFIFSHTALKEGWDNPNIFQICTLRDVGSEMERRQQIGRGLRLAVNDKGERVHDENVNRLTVIANESYEEYAKNLQNEYEQDYGMKFGVIEKITFSKLVRTDSEGKDKIVGQAVSEQIWNDLQKNGYINGSGHIQSKFDPESQNFRLIVEEQFSDLVPEIVDELKKYVFSNRISNAREKRPIKFKKEVHLSEEFKNLWDKIKQRTRYRVLFDTKDLIQRALDRIKIIEPIKKPKIEISRVAIDQSHAGFGTSRKLEEKDHETGSVQFLPDILAYLQKETELTRLTLVEILKRSERLEEFKINPQEFMSNVAREISRALHDLMLEGIQYEKVNGNYWEMSRLEEDTEKDITRYLNNLYIVQNQNKTLFDAIEYESEVERKFAQDLDHNVNVRIFVKLPPWFKIDTPIGTYNPDWAFVTEREEKLYFVRETKSSKDSEDRRKTENQKIQCGKKHFGSIGVDFEVVTSLKEVIF